MARILLVEDHVAGRQALAFMLEQEPDLEVVGQAGSLAEARRALAEAGGVDVALVDLALPDGDGMELVRDVRTANPLGAVLVLTGRGERRHLARALNAGAAWVLHKSADVGEIVAAVRALASGEPLLAPPEAVELLRLAEEHRGKDEAALAALGRLTARERAVLQALAEGLSDKEIAARLDVSVDVVQAWIASVFDTLGVDSRVQAVAFAARHGLVALA